MYTISLIFTLLVILICEPWHLNAYQNGHDLDSLLVASDDNLARLSIPGAILEPFHVSDISGSKSADFDVKNNCLYWSNSDTQEIRRKCFNNGANDTEEVLYTSMGNANAFTSIAYDWTSGLLYFTDSSNWQIRVIDTTMKTAPFQRSIIFDPDYCITLHLAIHPGRGYLFWAAQSEYDIRIYRSNLDGTKIKRLHSFLSTSGYGYAFSYITIDYDLERIVWSNLYDTKIGSTDFNGGDIRVYYRRAHALAVAGDYMYWFDNDELTFQRMKYKERDAATNVTQFIDDPPVEQLNLANNQQRSSLRLISPSLQSTTNACSNKEHGKVCSHVCVGAPNNEFACLCPETMEIIDRYPGKCLCPGARVPMPDGKCPELKNNCDRNEFECSNNECLPDFLACDGERDCSDGADEVNCSPCLPYSHRCESDGRCVPE